MKKLILILSLIACDAFADSGDVEKKIKAIEDYKPQWESVLNRTNAALTEMDSLPIQKMIPEEKTSYQKLKTDIEEVKRQIEYQESLFGVNHVKTKLKELYALEAEEKKYKENQNRLKEISSKSDVSDRFKKYISNMDARKYNMAKTFQVLLTSPEEKLLAEEYEKSQMYVLSNEGIQASNKKEMASLEKKLSESLEVSENAIKETANLETQLKSLTSQKDAMAQNLSMSQINLNLAPITFKSQYECTLQNDFVLSSGLPGHILIRNKNMVKAIIKIDPNNSEGYTFAGSGTSYDYKKVICKLDPVCSELLSQNEKTYSQATFFNKYKQSLVLEELNEIKTTFQSDQGNGLKVFQEMNKLGGYSIPELIGMMDPVMKYVSELDGNIKPMDYLAKIKNKINEELNLQISGIKHHPNTAKTQEAQSDATNAMKYIFLSNMESAVERLIKSKFLDDKIQNHVFSKCNEMPEDEFCRSAKSWRDREEILEAGTELVNLTPKDCPFVVFRKAQAGVENPFTAGCDSIAPNPVLDELEKNMKAIEVKQEK